MHATMEKISFCKKIYRQSVVYAEKRFLTEHFREVKNGPYNK